LSEEFILNLVQQQPSRFSTDAGRLVDLKGSGVSERIIAAVAKKNPPQEPLTSLGLLTLAKAKFSDDFLLDLVNQQSAQIAADPTRLAEMKTGGISERVLAAVVKKSPSQQPVDADGVVQLTKAGFSDGFILDLINSQPARFSGSAARIVELKQAGVSERVLAALVGKGTTRELAQGTEIVVRLIDEIDSEKSKEGDEFRASLDEPLMLSEQVIAPKGADAKVKLVTEKESGKLTGKAELTVALVSVTVDGKAVPVETSSVSQASGSRGARTAKTAAATGVVGAVIGAIAGGGRGAAIGAGAGAAAGAGSQVFMKGQRVRIPSETLLNFTTASPVRF
jgi:hypothetical protein